MKTPLLTLTALLLTFGAVLAPVRASASPATPLSSLHSGASLTLASAPASSTLDRYLTSDNTSHFAQLETARSLPVSPTMVFALVVFVILGMRLMALRQAHALAEHERHSHHGRAQMFRSLHEERSSRD